MPALDATGYLLVSLRVSDDDTPESDPAHVAERVAETLRGDTDVVEVQTVFSDGAGGYRIYGPSIYTGELKQQGA